MSYEKHTNYMIIDIRRLEKNKVATVKGSSTRKEWHLSIVYWYVTEDSDSKSFIKEVFILLCICVANIDYPYNINYPYN